MSKFTGTKTLRVVASTIALCTLAACGGGGGGGSGAGAGVAVSGTVARGAVLANASVSLTCANGAVITGTTSAAGTYAAATTSVVYPCAGSATQGAITYRGILFAGGVANFTPLTDMLVETVLAASAAGSASLSLADFITKFRSDSTFAASVSSASAVATYRAAVIQVVRTQLLASGKTAAQADAILAASAAFESTTFAAGSALDVVLDNTGSVLLDTLGRLISSVISAVAAIGNTLPLPSSGATGGTGGTGGTTGGSGTTG